jgi:hypothetical protein
MGGHFPRMSTLAEIETALTELAPEDLVRVEAMLRRLREREEMSALVKLERENGFDVFPERAGGAVTVERVRQLCTEEGI